MLLSTNLYFITTTDFQLKIYGFNGFTNYRAVVIIRKFVKFVNL
jgi:hypothetical protein